ncbi:MAG: 2-polyprenyl-6-methoxyphenol hydroxylase-like FAD-dependent oxidoreductase [Methylophilaceae bacterium]|jgi:2-polyprenyl-6-methoxyphenol hydroxylase-like FAD-dependent oxidoreductase
MVSTHAIRRGLYEEVKYLPDVIVVTDVELQSIESHTDHIQITIKSNQPIKSRLLVAADSCFPPQTNK